jgi:hypothetical protein
MNEKVARVEAINRAKEKYGGNWQKAVEEIDRKARADKIVEDSNIVILQVSGDSNESEVVIYKTPSTMNIRESGGGESGENH